MDHLKTHSLKELLRETPVFDHLNEKALEKLSLLFFPLDLPQGERLPIRRGYNEPYMYLIASGGVQLNLNMPDAPSKVLITLNRTDFVGGFLSYVDREYEVGISTNAESSVFQISKEDLQHFFHNYPEAYAFFSRLLKKNFYKAQLSLFLLLEFGINDPDMLNCLEQDIAWKELQSGGILFRQGETANSIYLVLSGRLKSVERTATGETRLSNIINPGQVSGEVAFLTRSERIATVFAVRDSVVAGFSRSGFNKLLGRHPNVMTQVAKLLGHRFKFRTSEKHASQFGKTYALIPSQENSCIKKFASKLEGVIKEWGSVTCITSSDIEAALGIKRVDQDTALSIDASRIAQWLEQLEFTYDYVLLVADRSWSYWNEKLLHYSDHLLIVADADQACMPSTVEEKISKTGRVVKHQSKTLVLIHPKNKPISNTRVWLQGRELGDWCHIRTGFELDMQRLGRILTGNANALVLGGGGARGYAHIGVIRALEESGIPVDMVCGTSVGAIISSAHAMGFNSSELAQLCKKHLQKIFDYTLPVLSLFRGKRIGKQLQAVFGEQQIEDLVISFFCISTNLSRAEQMIHDRGSLFTAIRSSMSLPAMVPPVCKNGDLIVDGGLLNNLPIDEMRKRIGNGKIIAVDISPKLDLANNENFAPDISGFKLFMSRVNPFKKSVKTPSILQVLERSITVAAVNYSLKIQEKKLADLYLELPVESIGTLDYDKVDRISSLGYAASVSRIRDWAKSY